MFKLFSSIVVRILRLKIYMKIQWSKYNQYNYDQRIPTIFFFNKTYVIKMKLGKIGENILETSWNVYSL